MSERIYPVACPKCGEFQNMVPGGFRPEREPFGPVRCMVCNRQFTKAEYLDGLARRTREMDTLSGPSPERV